ncbi:uncharacterized protein [Ptychodera flava]|uniref:uncharacterized protein n=1 Tax=Ptychodera flava TaxID=63121 RepID=UPI003969D37D
MESAFQRMEDMHDRDRRERAEEMDNLGRRFHTDNGGVHIMPTKFTGRESDCPHKWLKKFEMFSNLKRLAIGNRIDVFGLLMADEAERWFTSQPDDVIQNWDVLRATFVERFAKQGPRWRNDREIRSIQQGIGETVEAYAGRLKDKCDRYGRTDAELLSFFLQGLRPKLMKFVAGRDPEDFKAAFAFARTGELVVDLPDEDRRSTASHESELTKVMMMLVEQNRRLMEEKNGSQQASAAATGLQPAATPREDTEQDKVGGGFDASQALIGSITGFNLWSRALNNDEIAAVWKDCSIGGDIFAWNVADFNISGDVTETKGNFCDKPAVHKQSEEAGQTLELTSADTYVSALGQIPALAALTSCIWVKTSADGAKATLVSYAASTHDNEFLLYTTSGLKIFVKGTKKTTDLKVDDGKWHHVCVTWTSNGGTWIYYDNGAQYTSGSGLQSGKTITGGGSLILGQEQDKVGGGLDASQALLGSITGFSLWSRTLSGDEVAEVFNDCSIGGDVFAWGVSDLYIGGDVLRISDGMCDKPAKGTESPETCVYPVPVSNVAQGKLATQSSDKPNKDGGAEKAVDGNTGGEWKASKSCSWTRRELQPWWKVDLGSSFDVYEIRIFNRRDCCRRRILNAQIRVGDSANFEDNPVCGKMVVGNMFKDQPIVIRCGCETPMRGRYVSLQLIDKTKMLNICELQVMTG